MPATSKSQQRLFGMALAVRKGDLPRSKVWKAVLDIVDSDMTNKEIEDFTVLKESNKYRTMKPLIQYINEQSMNESGLILAGLAGLAIGVLLTGAAGFGMVLKSEHRSISSIIANWRRDKKIQKIVDRIKNEPDIQEYVNNPNKRGWREVLSKHLDENEIQYLNVMSKKYFKEN